MATATKEKTKPKKMKRSTAWKLELERIRKQSRTGKLSAKAVVDAARDRNSPLHSKFTWDDRKCGQLYRLEQARKLISVFIESEGPAQYMPVYVSLVQDRQGSGGYRRTEQVVSSAALRKDLRETAIKELAGWIDRWNVMVPDLVAAVSKATGVRPTIHQPKPQRRPLELAQAGH